MKVKEVNKVDNHELTPPYARYLVRLIRPFPDFDFFFIKPLRQKAVQLLQLKRGDRVIMFMELTPLLLFPCSELVDKLNWRKATPELTTENFREQNDLTPWVSIVANRHLFFKLGTSLVRRQKFPECRYSQILVQ